MAGSVRISGQKKLMRHINKMANPALVFDKDVKAVALKGVTDLKKNTNAMTGNTRRGWIAPYRKGPASYVVSNKTTTASGHSVVEILDKGRKEVRPKKAGGRLYIPLSNKGRSKKAGAPIPKGLVFGVDYVLAKKARATKGTKFVEESAKKMGTLLTKKMIATIRSVHRGQ